MTRDPITDPVPVIHGIRLSGRVSESAVPIVLIDQEEEGEVVCESRLVGQIDAPESG